MIARVIRWSIGNRFLVLLATVFIAVAGVVSVKNMPLDALPDLSDVQVIVRTPYPGQAPQLVEEQVTYPLSTMMLSVPGNPAALAMALKSTRSPTGTLKPASSSNWELIQIGSSLSARPGQLLDSASKNSISQSSPGRGFSSSRS